MSSDFPSGQPDSGTPQAGVSTVELDGPGRLIRAARERAQISLEELAAQTKLARATLEALERDDFSRLSEPVYVQGYYRKCAKALGLSAEELVGAYQRLAHPGRVPVPSKLLLAGESSELAGSGQPRFSGWWVALLVVAGILLLLWAASRFVRMPPAAVSETTEMTAPAPAGSETSGEGKAVPPKAAAESPSRPATRQDKPEAAAQEAAPAGEAAAAAPQQAPAPTAAGATRIAAAPATAEPPAPATVQTSQPSAAEQKTATPAALGAGNTLELEFNGDSWVRITDAKGTVLLSGTQRAGQRKSLSGVPPYAMIIGNAHEVQVFYDGKPVAFKAYVSGNSTARFVVP